MPTINNNRPANTTATGTTGVGAAAAAATAATTPTATAPLRSAAGQIVAAKPVAINGLGSVRMDANNTTNRFAPDQQFDTLAAGAHSATKVTRGFITVDAEPIVGGCRLQVQTFHRNHTGSRPVTAKPEKMTLFLMAEVLDTKTKQLRPITLSVIAKNQILNPNGDRGEAWFDIKYDDINAYLQARNPALKIVPGHTSLAVAAKFSTGHQAGGFARNGDFRLPATGTVQNLVGVRTAGRADAEETSIPLDLQVAYPAELTRAAPHLKTDGNVLTRLESELKGAASKQEMTAAITKMYGIAHAAAQGDHGPIEALLGKDWTVETVSRYWLKDDGSTTEGRPGRGMFAGFRVDADGLPVQDPMRDTYMDDSNLGMTGLEGAVRLRTNKQGTLINVKPGGGREDTNTGIRQRIEVGLELRQDTSVADATRTLNTLNGGKWKGTPFNHAQSEVAKLGGDVKLANSLKPWLDVTQDRHKFTVRNQKTGVEIEFSFDKVVAQTLRPQHNNADGTPRKSEFYVLEAELDHLQLSSSNQSTFAAGGANSGSFANDSAQDTWLKSTSDDVTMVIEPRLHELEDLKDKSFRSTGSYKSFERVAGALVPALFPNGLQHGRQKAAHAADVMGLVFFSDADLVNGVKNTALDSGYKWTPELSKAVADMVADPKIRVKLQRNLTNGGQRDFYSYLRSSEGSFQVNNKRPSAMLEYEPSAVVKRVEGQLASLGYTTTPEVAAMFQGITAAKLRPNNFEMYFAKLQSTADNQVLNSIASSLGVSPAPKVGTNIDALIGSNTTWGRMLRDKLEEASVTAADAPAIEAYFKKLHAGGVTLQTIRSAISSMHSGPENRLKMMDRNANLPGQPPKLSASPVGLAATSATNLRSHDLLVDDAFKSFLGKVAANSTIPQATSFVSKLRRDPQQHIAAMAKSLGIPQPKLAFDFGSIDAKAQALVASNQVLYDAGLKKFVRDVIAAGISSVEVRNMFKYLNSTSDLSKAVQNSGVPVSGVTFPKVNYDHPATEARIMQTMGAYSAALDTSKLRAYVDAALATGLTPAQVNNMVSSTVSYGKERGAQNASKPMQSLPDLPYSVDNLVGRFKTTFGTKFTAEREAYVRKALSKAFAHKNFNVRNLWGSRWSTVAANIQTWSGEARPSGV